MTLKLILKSIAYLVEWIVLDKTENDTLSEP